MSDIKWRIANKLHDGIIARTNKRKKAIKEQIQDDFNSIINIKFKKLTLTYPIELLKNKTTNMEIAWQEYKSLEVLPYKEIAMEVFVSLNGRKG